MDESNNQMNQINNQWAGARAALERSGISTRQLGEESRRKALEWIYRWGFSSSAVVQDLLNRKSGGYAQQLTKQGWLKATKTGSGTPATTFTLTKMGLQEAERHATEFLPYIERKPYKVRQPQIRHYLLAQMATIYMRNAEVLIEYSTERMFAQCKNKPGIKRPDIIWEISWDLGGSKTIGVEIELTQKYGKTLDKFIIDIIQALTQVDDIPAKYDFFIIISDSIEILNNYRAAMSPKRKISVKGKNEWGRTRRKNCDPGLAY